MEYLTFVWSFLQAVDFGSPVFYVIGWVLLTLYTLWFFYLAVMNLKRAKDAGTMTPVAKFLAYGIVLPGAILDVVVNVLATIPFWDIPKEWTLSQRLSRYYVEGSDNWRSKAAEYIARNFLNTFDPSGQHID